MEEIVSLISNHGVSVVIIALFIWDWVSNKKEIKNTLNAIRESNEAISMFNHNISKSLDLLQKSLDNQTEKIDRLLERCHK